MVITTQPKESHMATKTTKTEAAAKPGRKPVKTNAILMAVKESKGKATAISVDASPSMMGRMVKLGLLKVTGDVRKPQRGRPAFTYGLTDKGRKVAAKAS